MTTFHIKTLQNNQNQRVIISDTGPKIIKNQIKPIKYTIATPNRGPEYTLQRSLLGCKELFKGFS
jgi:hypothetical protein